MCQVRVKDRCQVVRKVGKWESGEKLPRFDQLLWIDKKKKKGNKKKGKRERKEKREKRKGKKKRIRECVKRKREKKKTERHFPSVTPQIPGVR